MTPKVQSILWAAGIALAAIAGGALVAGRGSFAVVALAAPAVLVGLLLHPEWGLVILAFTIPFEGVTRLGSGATGVRLLGMFVSGVWLLRLLWDRRKPVVPVGAIVLFALVILTGLSMSWAIEPARVVPRTITMIQLFVLYVMYANTDRRTFRSVLWAFVLGTIVSVVSGFLNPTLFAEQTGRLSGGGLDPNTFAPMMVVGMCMGFGLLARERGVGKRTALLVCMGLGVLAIGLSGSRTGALAGVPFALFVLRRTISKPSFVHVFALVALAIGTLSIVQVGSSETTDRFGEITSEASHGFSGRRQVWEVGRSIFSHHQVLGVGAGNFPVAAAQDGRVDFWKNERVRAEFARSGKAPAVRGEFGSHQTYLGQAAELGIIGLLLFATFIVLHLGAGLRRWGPQAAIRDALFFGLLALNVAFFSTDWQYRKVVYFTCGLIAAGARNWGPRSQPEQEPLPEPDAGRMIPVGVG